MPCFSDITYELGFVKMTVDTGLPVDAVVINGGIISGELLEIDGVDRVFVNDDGTIDVWRPIDASNTWPSNLIDQIKWTVSSVFFGYYTTNPQAQRLAIRRSTVSSRFYGVDANFLLTDRSLAYAFPIRDNNYFRQAPAQIQQLLRLLDQIDGIEFAEIKPHGIDLRFGEMFPPMPDAVRKALELVFPSARMVISSGNRSPQKAAGS